MNQFNCKVFLACTLICLFSSIAYTEEKILSKITTIVDRPVRDTEIIECFDEFFNICSEPQKQLFLKCFQNLDLITVQKIAKFYKKLYLEIKKEYAVTPEQEKTLKLSINDRIYTSFYSMWEPAWIKDIDSYLSDSIFDNLKKMAINSFKDFSVNDKKDFIEYLNLKNSLIQKFINSRKILIVRKSSFSWLFAYERMSSKACMGSLNDKVFIYSFQKNKKNVIKSVEFSSSIEVLKKFLYQKSYWSLLSSRCEGKAFYEYCFQYNIRQKMRQLSLLQKKEKLNSFITELKNLTKNGWCLESELDLRNLTNWYLYAATNEKEADEKIQMLLKSFKDSIEKYNKNKNDYVLLNVDKMVKLPKL